MSAEFIFPPPPFPSVAIAQDARRFPVRRIFCIALNYAAHAREMGKDPAKGGDAEPPVFFSKPADAVVESGATIPYPTLTHNLHHEIELVAALGKGGADIPAERALDCVFGYAAGIDLTRRDLQTAARSAGLAVGHVKRLRPFRAHRRDQPRRRHRPSDAGAHRALRQWRAATGGRP